MVGRRDKRGFLLPLSCWGIRRLRFRPSLEILPLFARRHFRVSFPVCTIRPLAAPGLQKRPWPLYGYSMYHCLSGAPFTLKANPVRGPSPPFAATRIPAASSCRAWAPAHALYPARVKRAPSRADHRPSTSASLHPPGRHPTALTIASWSWLTSSRIFLRGGLAHRA